MGESSLLLVFTNGVPGREAEFDEWYGRVHIPDVLAVPGVVAAQRFEVAPLAPTGDGGDALPPPPHSFLAIYEIDGDANEVVAEFSSRFASGQMQISDSMDLTTVALSVWSPSGARREQTLAADE